MCSFKDIIKQLEYFAINHKQINEFGWGEIYNISTKDLKFPYMHVLPKSSKKNGALQQLNLEIYLMDLQNENDNNLLDIMNNIFFIGNDIISEFIEDNNDLGFEVDEKNISIYPFTGAFDDYTSGMKWVLDVNFKQSNDCSIIPLNN